jgi:glycosyltransferase involved in cell wall biosynthesis
MPPNPLPADVVVDHLRSAQHPMRIAVVTETYPPEVNGVALSIAQLVEGLRQRGHDLQLVRPRQAATDAADNGERFQELLLRSLPIPRYPHLKMGLPAKAALVELWARQRPDVVHIATEGPLGWSALQAAQKLRLPVTSDFRTHFDAYSRHYGVGWLRKPIMAYLRKFHNRALTTMVPTDALCADLVGNGFRHVQVVGRGVDTERFSPAHRSDALRASWGAGPATRVVACVGRLAPEKNLGVLLDAFAALRQAQPDSRLLLVGDGPSRRELQARCPDAIFAGMRSGSDLAVHYASADLFLFPSTTETFGNVTPEAMASGLALLAYDYAAAARLVRSGANGLLVPLDQTAQFIASAVTLASSPAVARALGVQAREAMLTQGWDHIVGQVEAILRQAQAQGVPVNGHALLNAVPRAR